MDLAMVMANMESMRMKKKSEQTLEVNLEMNEGTVMMIDKDLKNLSIKDLEAISKKEGFNIRLSEPINRNDAGDLKIFHGLDIYKELAQAMAEEITLARKRKERMEANKKTKEYLEAVSDKVGEDEEESGDTVSKKSGKD